MTDFSDYLSWRVDLSFKSSPFNPVDGGILSAFSYMPVEAYIDNEYDKSLSICDFYSKVKEDGRECKHQKLLADMAVTERFGNIKILAAQSKTDDETQTQFFGVTLELGDGNYAIAFRGTDNTVVGWKEDFNMGFSFPVPAQKMAKEYLESAAQNIKGHIYVCGHSKGGNIAVYSAAFVSAAVQKRINDVYNYDGPGFDEEVLEMKGYKRICEKINTFVPQSSIVGMLLGHAEKYTIVHSKASGGFLQHDLTTWEVMQNKFVCLETVKNSSKVIDNTVKDWMNGLSQSELEKLIDAMYSIIKETNAETLNELGEKWLSNALIISKAMKNMDEDTRNLVSEAMKLLAQSAKESVTKNIKSKFIKEEQ